MFRFFFYKTFGCWKLMFGECFACFGFFLVLGSFFVEGSLIRSALSSLRV
jgi:hypothetical protein